MKGTKSCTPGIDVCALMGLLKTTRMFYIK